MLYEEVIIGFLNVLIRKLILSGRALNVEYTQLYMCCAIKLVGYLKKKKSVEYPRRVSLPKLSLKGRNWVVRMKSSPSSVVGVYINSAI